MPLSASRIITPGQTPHAHEREAFDFVVRELPDTDPYRLWAFVDLIDGGGRRYDLDLLVLGYHALYLVEVKSHVGTLTGDEVDWTVTFPDGGRTSFENPLRTTTHKARVLGSLLDARFSRDHDARDRGLPGGSPSGGTGTSRAGDGGGSMPGPLFGMSGGSCSGAGGASGSPPGGTCGGAGSGSRTGPRGGTGDPGIGSLLGRGTSTVMPPI